MWEVKNPADETMYFTIGGHPAFRFAEKNEKKIRLPAGGSRGKIL